MAKIGIFDSGVGGLSVFREIRKILPDEQYVFYSDNANCPYGEKSPEFIRQRSCEITDFLLSKGCDMVVVACNTATAAAIEHLRNNYQIRFVGLEPAVKMAVGLTKTGTIGVLATAGTLKGSKYKTSKERYASGVKVAEHVGEGFVELVESGILSGEEAESIVRKSLCPLLDEGSDVIVLGCTHYPFLMGALRDIAGEGVAIIDPAPAVAKHVIDILEQEGIAYGNGPFDLELVASGSPEALDRTFKLI